MSTATASKNESRNAPRSQNKEEDMGDFEVLVENISGSVKEYGSKHPLAMAGIVFLAGFYFGWKVKPW